MERSEPTLVPQWLKNAGSLTGGGTTSQSDDHAASRLARNKSFVNSNGLDFGRSSSTDRTTSSYFRRSSSSNGSGQLRSYSSYGRNLRDRDWEKDIYDSRDKDKSILGDRRHRDISDPLKLERDGLRRSQSMVSAKRGDQWPKKVATDSSSPTASKSNGSHAKGNSAGGLNKAIFERDFPSLGAEERSLVPEIGRVPSPGLSSAIQNLPIGSSSPIGGEKWTSALAEVPVLVGSNGTSVSSMQPAPASSSTSVGLGSASSLNMAEAVAHGPNRAQTAPQLSVGTQRLEELAIKQSRQLIPVTPSLPKPLVLSSSDKQKSKIGQQQLPVSSSLPVNHSPRGGPVKGDVSKASTVGKLHVLKPVREKNGVTPVVKDNLSPTSGSKVVNSTLAAVPPVSGSLATRAPQSNPVPDRKPLLTVLEKRPTSQAQSRNDFFNLVRKKSMSNSSSADSAVANTSPVPDSGTAESPSLPDKLAGVEDMPAPSDPQIASAPSNESFHGNHLPEDRGDLAGSGDGCLEQKSVSNQKHPSSDPIFSEEEEAAFLRSLGWEENADEGGDEGGLTEEEINAFYRDVAKYINSKSSLKILQGVQPKFVLLGGIGNISSGLSSSDTKLES